ncbi:PREDICTED: alpha-endosulfine [Pygoscelis adeliae]|nr:PREDICTED: alpha-endosulfine [Pygoscelis adeliae]
MLSNSGGLRAPAPLLATWEGKSRQSDAQEHVPLTPVKWGLQCLVLGEPGTPIPPASTLRDCRLHPAGLLVLSDAKGFSVSQMGRRLAGAECCHAYCVEHAVSDSPSASGFSRGPHLARQARCRGLDVLLNIVLRHHRCVFFCGAEGLSTPLFVFQDAQEKETVTPERAEEAKLKAKYPNLGQKPGGSDFLMKRLQKGQKYFDSGDYNMAKAKMKNKQLPSAGPDKNLVTGDHIPTPQDLPQRKSSLVTSKLAG